MLYRLGSGSLATWDEGLYAVVSREIFRSGDWLRLTVEGNPWFDKPPLALWATALFYKIFGIHEFSARFFSALCGAGAVIVTYLLGRRLFDRWTGFCGALVLLSSSHFLRVARFGVLDAPFLFFLTLTFYFFWLGRIQNRHLIFSGAALGLAMMTKGFGAFLIFPVIGLYCLWAGRLEILGRPAYWAGLALAALIALPWHLYEFFYHHDDFMRNVVLKHLVERTTGAIEGHAGGLDFYLHVLVNKYHPWILVGVFSAPLFLWRSLKERGDETIFLTVWMWIVFIFFSLVRTKLAWYILPLYPALSLSVAWVLVKILKENRAFYAQAVFLAVLALHAGYSHILTMDYSRPIKNLAPAVRRAVPESEIVYLYHYHEQFAADFYFERKSRYLDTPEAFEAQAAGKELYCLVRAEDFKALEGIAARFKISPAASADGFIFLKKSI